MSILLSQLEPSTIVFACFRFELNFDFNFHALLEAAHKTQPKSKRKGGDEDAVSVADLLETACDELQKAYEKAPAECQDAVLSMTDALEDKE
eukprot:m.139615 g.139615  ORF g.139615 m.139615 type:complete len:92 (-) comp14020_c0_seq2:210-485(-)